MTRSDPRRLRLAAVALSALVAVGACAGSGGDGIDLPSSTSSTDATTVEDGIVTRAIGAVGDGSRPDGFDTAVVRITAADGSVCEVCMWLADSSSERIDGLRGVDDLGGLAGMAFVWDRPDDGNFVMIDTPTPLSIAWFDPDGAYLGEADMDPCVEDDSDDCRRYNTIGRYSLAIEMFRDGSGAGQLHRIGVGPGSTAEIIEVFDSSSCEQAR